MDKLFKYSENRNIDLYVYKQHDFPYLKTICDSFAEDIKNNTIKIKAKSLLQLKSHDKKSILIIVTLLLNNENINDVFYQINNLSNLATTNYDTEVFQIILNCQYDKYHDYVNALKSSIKSYIENKFSNKPSKWGY